VTRLPLALRQAAPDDLGVVLELLSESIRWLQEMGLDQWAEPWPDEAGRNRRIARDLADGKTWLILDDNEVAGTITIDPADRGVWPSHARGDKAVYVRKLIVRRHYAGLGLGARLLDWAADFAARRYQAELIRIDVWTTNWRLHHYYRRQGFQFCELMPDTEYPSRALFERSTSRRLSDYRWLLAMPAPLAQPRC
jgi:ribosomal protein S18 acetylase RimI-like enzyme